MNRSASVLVYFSMAVMIFSCGRESSDKKQDGTVGEVKQGASRNVDSYDPKRGEGKYSEENLKLEAFSKDLANKGRTVSEMKCTACHKLTSERLVGPGWKGVTERNSPHWLMNFITNPDPMIDKDPKLQAQLEMCLIRMPNQGLSDEEARSVLEFMREIDASK